MAKRFTKSAIKWAEIEKRVPPEQKNEFKAFRAKSIAYLQRVESNSAEMPKIDWEAYKKLLPESNIVDTFKARLEKYEVPYPKDTVTSQIDEQWHTIQKDIERYCAEHKRDAAVASQELKEIRALPKFEDMTIEMYFHFYPENAIDPVYKPTFWPHTPEEQPDSVVSKLVASKSTH